MRTLFIAVPALLLAGGAVADDRPDPLDPKAKAPAVEFRSALEGYRPFADPEQRDWRKSNDEVGAAGGHAGHKPATQSPKPQLGKPEASGPHGGRHK
jgi:hypothetical protein